MDRFESFNSILDKDLRSLPFYIECTGITFPDPSYHVHRSCSPVWTLEYIISGKGVVEVNGKSFYPKTGDLYLLPGGTYHHYYASKEDPFKKIWIGVNGSICRHLINIYNLSGQYFFENIPGIYPLFEDFFNTCALREGDTHEIFDKCCGIFLKMVQMLANYNPKKRNGIAAQAKSFIDRNIYRPIEVADIARDVNISVSQISRLFKEEYDCTIYSYIIMNKIETAKALLIHTNQTIKEIAYLLSFSDEHYFSNTFKEKTGMRPSEYRKRN